MLVALLGGVEATGGSVALPCLAYVAMTYVQQQQRGHFSHPILIWTSKGFRILSSLSSKESLQNSGVHPHACWEHAYTP